MGQVRPPIAAAVDSVPLTREEHRVVVVGSGFGGGVAALRLAEAGVRVTVLERGIRWPTGPNASTFPSPLTPDKRILWRGSDPQVFGRPLTVEPYAGLWDAQVGATMTPICGTGVGGGSLVYQGMTLQPAEAVFDRWFPQELDWRTMDRVHYPRVARMLGLATAPDELVESPTYEAARVFARNVSKAGLPLTKIPMPIDWNYALAELRGEMRPSYTNGDCAAGVNNGGKNSVDVTYIAAAERTGNATVEVLHNVTDVERAPDGRWIVHVERTDVAGTVLENKILTTTALIMAAGSVHTTKLLVRASAKGQIPDLPDQVGQGWGTNGDRIYSWSSAVENFGSVQGGPVVYGSLNWSDPDSAYTIIQASIPPLPLDPHTTVMVGYGVSDGRGFYSYDAATDDAYLTWPAGGDLPIQDGFIDPAARRIAGPASVLVDSNRIAPTTWHPLGGACIGTVCDLEGRVHGQRGLYVLDGALMPGTTAACNPSMTIAAVAERALDRIVAVDAGSVF